VVSQQSSLDLAYDAVFSDAIVSAFDSVFAFRASNRNLRRATPTAARAAGFARDSAVAFPLLDFLVRNLDCPEVLEHQRNSLSRKNNCARRAARVLHA